MDYIQSQICSCIENTEPQVDKNYFQFLEAYMFISFGAIALEFSRQALNSFTRKTQELSNRNCLDEILDNIRNDIIDLDSSSDDEEEVLCDTPV